MSSKEKRKSTFFGFGSSKVTPSSLDSKRRTFILPKDNEISDKDLPRRKNTLDGVQNIPQLPRHRLSDSPLKKVRSGVGAGTNVTSNTTTKITSNTTSNTTTNASPNTKTNTINTPAPPAPPSKTITTNDTSKSPQLNTTTPIPANPPPASSNPAIPANTITSKRASMIRKPPPPLVKTPSASPSPVPAMRSPSTSTSSSNNATSKPELNILTSTTVEEDSAMEPSPVASSHYSPYSPLNVQPRSTTSLVPRSSSNLRLVSPAETVSPLDLETEFLRIEELLNQSTLLNERVDHHLSHSRHASAEIRTELMIPKDKAVHNLHSIVKETSDDDDGQMESDKNDQMALDNSDQLLTDLVQMGSPYRNRVYADSSGQFDAVTTDDEFFDADNGDKDTNGDSGPLEQDISGQTGKIIVEDSVSDVDNVDSNVDNIESNVDNVDSNVESNVDSIVDSTGSNVESTSFNALETSPLNTRKSRLSQEIIDSPREPVVSNSLDISSVDLTPEPLNQVPIQSPRLLRQQSSMDAITGHISSSSQTNEDVYNYDGADYVMEDGAVSQEEVLEDFDLQDRYILQQEEFFQNQNNLSPSTYLNSRSSQMTSIHSEPQSDSDSGSESSRGPLENLSFTARSPFYSPFEYTNDSQPRRMIVTNNVSDEEMSIEQPDEVKDLANKRSSYFGDLDVDDYVEEALHQQLNTLQVHSTVSPDPPRSPVITPTEGQTLSHVYDRREEATVVPVSHSDRTSHVLKSCGVLPDSDDLPSTRSHGTKKPLRRRPPPDFPVTGRTGRSLSVNQEQQPVFVENAPITEKDQSDKGAATKSKGLNADGSGAQASSSNSVAREPVGGVKSAYVMALRERTLTSYSPVGPPKWTLPVAIRSLSEKRKTPLSTKYSKTTMSMFKKGVLSTADIKHGNLKPRLLASEVDDDELTGTGGVESAPVTAAVATRSTTSTSGGSGSLAHTQLGAMVSPSNRMSSELHHVTSGSGSVYSSESQRKLVETGDDFMVQEFRGAADQMSYNDNGGKLDRSGSIKSYLGADSNGNGKLKLFIVNPDSDSD